MPEITIPERLQRRPQFRGLPVPFSVVVNSAGVPDFKVTSPERWLECVRTKLCALCGERLMLKAYYVGGPMCTRYLVFNDTGMHRECCLYALRVCPFLACRTDYASTLTEEAGTPLAVDASVIPVRPSSFYVFISPRYGVMERSGKLHLKLTRDQTSIFAVPEDRSPQSMDEFSETLP